MALHGTIEINGHKIGAWTATCLGRQPDGYADYRWETIITPPPLSPLDAATRTPLPHMTRGGTLTHLYTDGALVLAAKVLAAATAERDRDLEAPAHA